MTGYDRMIPQDSSKRRSEHKYDRKAAAGAVSGAAGEYAMPAQKAVTGHGAEDGAKSFRLVSQLLGSQ